MDTLTREAEVRAMILRLLLHCLYSTDYPAASLPDSLGSRYLPLEQQNQFNSRPHRGTHAATGRIMYSPTS